MNATRRLALAPAWLRWVRFAVSGLADDHPKLGLDPVEEPCDPLRERPILPHQRLADEHPRDPRRCARRIRAPPWTIPSQRRRAAAGSSARIRFTSPNTASSANSMSASNIAALPGKVAVERRLRHPHHAGEARGGDPRRGALLDLPGQGLEDLLAAGDRAWDRSGSRLAPPADERPHPRAREHLEQHRVLDPAVDDLGGADAALHRVEGAPHLRQHPARRPCRPR